MNQTIESFSSWVHWPNSKCASGLFLSAAEWHGNGPTQIPLKPPSFSTSPARVFSTRVMHIVHDLCALIALPVIHHVKRWALVFVAFGRAHAFFAFLCVSFFAHAHGARVLPLVPLLCAPHPTAHAYISLEPPYCLSSTFSAAFHTHHSSRTARQWFPRGTIFVD